MHLLVPKPLLPKPYPFEPIFDSSSLIVTQKEFPQCLHPKFGTKPRPISNLTFPKARFRPRVSKDIFVRINPDAQKFWAPYKG